MIRKRGKHGFYSACFRGLRERPDGSLAWISREVNLHTSDPVTAAALDAELRARERRHSASLRARAFARQLLDESPDAPPVHATTPTVDHRPRRLRLDSALDAAEKYIPVSDTARKIWNKFSREIDADYVDQLTAPAIHAYLSQYDRGHTYNNVRSAIGRLLDVTRMDSGLTSNPVDEIPTRRNDSEHQRPITEPEFLRLYAAAPNPWRMAFLIAWHTGLREIDVASLRWSEIVEGNIVHTPGKTRRFGRAVQIPIHAQLADAFARIPRSGPFILGHWWPDGKVPRSARRRLAEIFAEAGVTATPDGIVNFNSFRDSVATRLDEADLPRHATRGILGHRKDDTTDLYSHDLTTARRILALRPPAIDLFLVETEE